MTLLYSNLDFEPNNKPDFDWHYDTINFCRKIRKES